MRFIKQPSATSEEPRGNKPPQARGSKLAASVKLPSLPERPLVRIERLFAHRLRLLVSGLEHALFAAADALVGVQAFEDELCGRNLLFGALFRRYSKRAEFLDQSLNSAKVLECFSGRDRVGKLNLAP